MKTKNGANEKKQRERFYLDHFIKVTGLCPLCIEPGADPPDFVVILGGRRIAVEITEFHSGAKGTDNSPRRAVEEEWDRLRRLIEKERAGDAILKEIGTQVFFKGLRVPSRRERAQFVSALLAFVRKEAGSLTRNRTRFGEFGDDFPLLQAYLKCLDIYIAGCYISWEWNHNAAWVGLGENELCNILRPKLGKPRIDGVDEYWLLVVSGPHLSQSLGVPQIEEIRTWQQLNAHLGQGPYDRIYVFQYMVNRVLLWKPSVGWNEGCPPS